MPNTGTLKITTPGDREIAMSREFDAPRELVYEAYTKPELLKRWLGMHNGWSLAVCDIDLKVGGSYRYVWRHAGFPEMGMRGVYKEIVPAERIVATEQFDQSWYDGNALGTVTFVERAGRTTLTITMVYDSKDVRDAVLKSPMEQGMNSGFDALDQVLASMPRGGSR
jgi:uncharacterized protein YndB with AHSA1/START domain